MTLNSRRASSLSDSIVKSSALTCLMKLRTKPCQMAGNSRPLSSKRAEMRFARCASALSSSMSASVPSSTMATPASSINSRKRSVTLPNMIDDLPCARVCASRLCASSMKIRRVPFCRKASISICLLMSSVCAVMLGKG